MAICSQYGTILPQHPLPRLMRLSFLIMHQLTKAMKMIHGYVHNKRECPKKSYFICFSFIYLYMRIPHLRFVSLASRSVPPGRRRMATWRLMSCSGSSVPKMLTRCFQSPRYNTFFVSGADVPHDIYCGATTMSHNCSGLWPRSKKTAIPKHGKIFQNHVRSRPIHVTCK